MLESLISLFQGTYGLITAICLVVGLVLIAVEIFIPGFGICGITGISLIVFCMIFRTVTSGDFLHLLYLLVIALVVSGINLLIVVKSAKNGLLSKTPLIDNNTAIPKDYGSDEKNYGYLINKEGTTKTVCKPVGKMILDNVEYQVITNGDYLPAGTKVKVVEVDGSTIVVKKVED